MKEDPNCVSILNEDGSIEKIAYKELKAHEESIIEDHIGYGMIHSEYTEKDISDYKIQAYKELKDLKRAIRENHNILLKLDRITERYVLA